MDKLTNQNQWTWVNFTTKSPSVSRENSPSVVCHPWWGRNAREEALGARSEQLPGKMRKWENFQILMRLPKQASTLSLQEYPWFTKQSWWDYPSQPIKLRLRSVRKMRILFCWKKMHGAVKRWNLLVKKIKSKNYLKWVSVIVAPRLVGLLFGDEILLSY